MSQSRPQTPPPLSQEDQNFIASLGGLQGDIHRVEAAFSQIYREELRLIEKINSSRTDPEAKPAIQRSINRSVESRRNMNNTEGAIASICAIKDFGDSKAPVKLNACAKLIDQCIAGDNKCLDEFANIANQLETNGLDDISFNPGYLGSLLQRIGLVKIIDPKVDPNAIDHWLRSLRQKAGTNADELKRINQIANNSALLNMLRHFYVKVYYPELTFGTPKYDIQFSKLSKFKLLPRYSKHPTRADITLDLRGSRKPIDRILQVGGGNINNRHARFFDAIEKQFMMSGGGSSYPLVSPAFEKALANLMKDLESVGKTVEEGDLRKIRDIMLEYQNSEKKVQSIVMLIQKLRELVDSRHRLSEGQRQAMLYSISEALAVEERRLNEWKTQGRTVLNIFKHIRDESPISNDDLWKNARKAQVSARMEDIKDLFNYKNDTSALAYHFNGENPIGNTTSAWSEAELNGGVSSATSPVARGRQIGEQRGVQRGRSASATSSA